MSAARTPKPDVPTLSNLRLVRYATGWGHTPAEYAKALAAGEPIALKSTTHPVTGEAFVSVYRTTLAMPSSSKRAGEPNSVEVVAKVNPLPTVGKQLQSFFKRTKHHRQWRGHSMLRTAGVASAMPLALFRAKTSLGEVELLLLEHAPGKTLLELFADHQHGVPLPSLIAPALAQVLFTLERSGLWNRDPKPSNLLIAPSSGGDVRITLLDTVGVERRTSRHPSMLRHVVRLLLLETSGSNIPTPPQFTIDLITSALQLRAKRDANTPAIDGQVFELLNEIRQNIAQQDSTPKDNPIPPSS